MQNEESQQDALFGNGDCYLYFIKHKINAA